MGYFVYAYVVEGDADNESVTLTTTVLSSHYEGKKALFFWSEADHPPGLFSFASGTLHCTSSLSVLHGYPTTKRRGDKPGENPNLIQIEEDFWPDADGPVLFHFLLPARFVPCPNLEPLVTPSLPSIIVRRDRLSVTFVASGAADVRFWIKRLEQTDKFENYELHRLLAKPAERSTKASFEINLGIVKAAFGDK